MKKNLLMGAILAGLSPTHMVMASDAIHDLTHGEQQAHSQTSQQTIANNRAQRIQEARDILSSNVQAFKTAYQLCFDAANALLDRKRNISLSDDLINEAKIWMGNAINFGKDSGWPEGMRDDKKVLVLMFLRGVLFWFDNYMHTMLPLRFLEDSDDILSLKSAQLNLSQYARDYLSAQGPNLKQTEDEIRRFGEYPEIDFKNLFILPTLSSAQKIAPFTRDILIDPMEDYLNRIQILTQYAINGYNEGLIGITWDFVAFYCIKNNQFSENQADQIKKLRNFRTEKERIDFLNTKINTIVNKMHHLINPAEATVTPHEIKNAIALEKERDENAKKELEKKEAEKAEKKDDATDSTSIKATRHSKKKKKGKKNTKNGKKGQKNTKKGQKNQLSSQKASKDPKTDDTAISDKDSSPLHHEGIADQYHDAMEKNVAQPQDNLEDLEPSAVSPAPTPLPEEEAEFSQKPETKNEDPHPDEDEYVWDPLAQQEEFERYAQLKQQKNANDTGTQTTSPFAPIPYLNQAVTEKFLDIFGNKKGDGRNKHGHTGYQRQGWGSINELKATLEHAGWLFDDGFKSSTISFSVPQQSKEVKAPFLKFHNDHDVGEQDMREITRHFIIKGLEWMGYTEDFLLNYYNAHFVTSLS